MHNLHCSIIYTFSSSLSPPGLPSVAPSHFLPLPAFLPPLLDPSDFLTKPGINPPLLCPNATDRGTAERDADICNRDMLSARSSSMGSAAASAADCCEARGGDAGAASWCFCSLSF